jgi:hypothetical protein
MQHGIVIKVNCFNTLGYFGMLLVQYLFHYNIATCQCILGYAKARNFAQTMRLVCLFQQAW